MLSPSNFIKLAYTPDLTQAGVLYACQSLPHTYNRMGGPTLSRLRRIASGKSVELAFRRLLSDRGVIHDSSGDTPYTTTDRYDLAIRGRRCDLKSFVLDQKDTISRLRREPRRLLEAEALVPMDQLESGHLGEGDLYVFAFLTALFTHDQKELEQARAAGQPVFLIHALPADWSRPDHWAPLGPVALQAEAVHPTLLDAGGQDPNSDFQTELVHLPPGDPRPLRRNFYSLAYLHSFDPVDALLHLHCPARRLHHTVTPQEWGNMWVYGMEIILAGWIGRGEFKRQGRLLPSGSSVFQYSRTRTDNWGLPVRCLRPVEELLER